ncbi:hypothetical protein PENTCL1PPCAC_24655, partial [Pristionchus entomophagus]
FQMLHLKLFASPAIPLIFAYGSLVCLISLLRAWIPHNSLDDHQMHYSALDLSGEFLSEHRMKHRRLQEKKWLKNDPEEEISWHGR